jgi:hypothetical protein
MKYAKSGIIEAFFYERFGWFSFSFIEEKMIDSILVVTKNEEAKKLKVGDKIFIKGILKLNPINDSFYVEVSIIRKENII